ncbi:MAG: hypothetical protein ACI9K2_002899 [Myxococcota bacterium]|jgi:hypothetical protein
MHCPGCGGSRAYREAGLPVATCRDCGEIFDTTPAARFAPRQVTVQAGDGELRFLIPWPREQTGLWVLALVAILFFGSDSDGAELWHAVLGLPVVVGITYGLAAYTFNRTEILVTPAGLAVDHRPMPWRGSGVLIRRDALAQLHVRTVRHRKRGGERLSYDLMARLTDGRDVRLYGGVGDPEVALNVERRVEDVLGIEDQPVAYEHKPVL